ncbi:MAG: transglutaminaseTgpA domain-containing protein [Planctomycetota bacterium]|nr:transglutaminaseTgpA domain-containing protein [Planctomycetota bacterium]
MRLLYDVYTTRKRADLLLLAADCLALTCAVLFASGAFGHASWGRDAPLVAVWAVIPRGVASYLRWFERPRDFLPTLVLSSGIVVLISVLTFAGWELIWEARNTDERPWIGTALVILGAWGSGFLLFLPRAYRLHEFLLAAAILLALLERRPGAVPLVALFLLGLALSATTRHLLFDVFPGVKEPRLNLQNARALSALAALAGTVVFALVFLGLRPLLDSRRSPSWAGSLWSPSAGGGGTWARGGSRGDDPGGPGASTSERRRIGYPPTVRLSNLSRPRYDERVVFAARLVDESGRELDAPPREWDPRTFLWKGLTLSRFDPTTSSWSADRSFQRRTWNRAGTVERPPPSALRRPVRLEVVVAQPVFRSLVVPYLATEVGPVRPRRPDSYYVESGAGDIVPMRPAIGRGMRYYLRFQPWEAALSPLPTQPARGEHPDRHTLEVPSSAQVGVDLVLLARELELGGLSVQEAVEQLHLFFARDFKYNTGAFWRGGAQRLGAFLVREKIGDCAYFATSVALLLRASGVSTRLAVGFLGSEVDHRHPARLFVRNLRAHAWVEVYLAGAGWFPVDPTIWARPDASFVGPDGLASTTTPGENAQNPPDGGEDAPSPGEEARRRETEVARRDDGHEPSRDETPPPAPEDATDAPAPEDGEDYFSMAEMDPEDGGEGGSAWVAASFPEEGDLAFEEAGSGATSEPGDAPLENVSRGSRRLGVRSVILRTALVFLAILCAGLVLVTYLRPRDSGTEEEEEEEEEETDDSDRFGLPVLDGTPWEPSTARERLIHEYQLLQLQLSLSRNHRLPHQTPLEHGRRFRGRNRDLEESFRKLHQLVYHTLYGEQEADDVDVDQARKQCRRIRRILV